MQGTMLLIAVTRLIPAQVDVDALCSAAEVDARKDAYYTVLWADDGGGYFSLNRALQAVTRLEYAARHGLASDHARVQEANTILIETCRSIDEARADDFENTVAYHGAGFDIARSLLLFEGTPYLYADTIAKMRDGTEPTGSGHPDNRQESLRYWQDQLCYWSSRSIGIHEFNPRPASSTGTTNHHLQEIALAMMLCQIYGDEDYDPPDGPPAPMKDDTAAADDYLHYWQEYFMTWLSSGTLPLAERGVQEKNSAHYYGCYLGDLPIIRAYSGDPVVSKYAEIYFDLALADWAEDHLGGHFTGPKIRTYRTYYTGLRNSYLAVQTFLLFDSHPFAADQLDDLLPWGYQGISSIAAQGYDPTHADFPRVFVDLAVNKPADGYMVRGAQTLYGSSAGRPMANWVTPDYTIGFGLRSDFGKQHISGGVYINDASVRGLVITPIICQPSGSQENDPDDGDAPDADISAVVARDVAIVRFVEGEDDYDETEIPEKLYIGDGFTTKDYTSNPPWMFFRATARSGNDVFVAVRPFEGSTAFSANDDNGEIRVFSVGDTALAVEVSDSTRHTWSSFRTDVADNSMSSGSSFETYTSTRGIELRLSNTGLNHQVDGVTIDWDDYTAVLNNDYMSWDMGTSEATISYNGRTAFYDFDGNDDGVYDDPVKILDGTVPTTVHVIAPNGGEEWVEDQVYTIRWSSSGVGDVDLHYSTDAGGNWTEIATGISNTGSRLWTVPAELSTTCLVRVREAGSGTVVDTSDATFSIVAAPVVSDVEVVGPNGGELWPAESAQWVTWTAPASVTSVDIHLSSDGGASWVPVVEGIENTGSFVWTLPAAPCLECLVRVRDAGDFGTLDASDAPFEITGERVYRLAETTWIEAEEPSRNQGAFVEVVDATASAGAYMVVPVGTGHDYDGEGSPQAHLHYRLFAPDAGEYILWIRGDGPDSSHNSLNVRFDDGLPVNQGISIDGWSWREHGVSLLATAGSNHRLTVSLREDGTLFDRVVLTRDDSFNPSGVGPDVPCVLGLTLPTELIEGHGIVHANAIATIEPPPIGAGTAVVSFDESEIASSSGVELPAGSTSVAFLVSPVEDGIADGDQLVTVELSATGCATATADVLVRDSGVIDPSDGAPPPADGGPDPDGGDPQSFGDGLTGDPQGPTDGGAEQPPPGLAASGCGCREASPNVGLGMALVVLLLQRRRRKPRIE